MNDLWRVSQEKAQGLEPVYPEMWLMDLKAAADLAKFGGKALLDSGLSVTEKLKAIKSVENNFYKDGAAVKYGDSLVITNPNEAVFWSGNTNGVGGMDVAKQIANQSGGRTLEQLIEARQITMPQYVSTNADSVKAWQEISTELARKASGEVKATLGTNVRPSSIWINYELPALLKNPSVTKITTIDPKTGNKVVIFDRGFK